MPLRRRRHVDLCRTDGMLCRRWPPKLPCLTRRPRRAVTVGW